MAAHREAQTYFRLGQNESLDLTQRTLVAGGRGGQMEPVPRETGPAGFRRGAVPIAGSNGPRLGTGITRRCRAGSSPNWRPSSRSRAARGDGRTGRIRLPKLAGFAMPSSSAGSSGSPGWRTPTGPRVGNGLRRSSRHHEVALRAAEKYPPLIAPPVDRAGTRPSSPRSPCPPDVAQKWYKSSPPTEALRQQGIEDAQARRLQTIDR